MGIDNRDDAGVYRLNSEQAIIQTLDFFTPMVDDPYLFGQIAAVNALNDVYAMGGTPLLAMNIVCYPNCEEMGDLREILEGGLSKIKEAGALLAGGHSVDDNEPKYGLAVTGLVHPEKVLDNAGAQAGDVLFLTKPLGNGVITTAIKAEMASERAYHEAVQWMTMLNKEAAEVVIQVGAHALTDITGFGLMGHLHEMASASNVEVEVNPENLEFMEGALEYAQMGLIPGGAYENRKYLQDKIMIDHEIDQTIADLLFSPETAGGLLIAVNEASASKLQNGMQEKNCRCIRIGRVINQGFKPIRVRNN